MANAKRYGFQWAEALNGPQPTPIEYRVATGKDFNINGSSVDMNLNIGDPVTLLNTEYLDIAEGSEASGGTADTVLGIVVGIKWYYSTTKGVMVPTDALPSGVAWGTVQARASIVQVIPATKGLWYVQCDDASTATTLATYRAFIGEACDHILFDTNAQLKLNPLLDISTHSASSGQWQIVDIPEIAPNTGRQDFASTLVTAVVRCYEPIGGSGGVLV